jgi:peptidoglycan/LPS O-acetylase OafA/YrhL
MIKSNNHLNSIVYLRAIAALLVCLIHLNLITGFHATGGLQSIIDEGQLGVAIFFVISGFVLPYSLYKSGYLLAGFGRFLLGRIIRIDPPYWASIIVVFLVSLQPISTINVKSIILHITYLVPFIKGAKWFSDVYWTLSIEFQFYILIGLVYPWLSKLRPVYTLVAVIVPSIICIILKANFRGVLITNLYDFTIGYIAFLGFIKKINIKQTLAVLLLFSAYVMYFVSIKSGSIALITALAIIFYKREVTINPIIYLGDISYSLYLIHMPISVLTINLFEGLITDRGWLFIMSLISSLLFASIFNLLIEKPSIKLSHLYKYQANKATAQQEK